MNIKQSSDKKGFTLIEVLVVVGVVLILAVAVFYFLNPHQIITEGQDGNRVAGLSTLDKAISLYYSDALTNPATLYMGSSSVIYTSIPDPTATTTAGTNCAGVGLSSPGITYHCAASSTYLNSNGTGWIPINFSSYSAGNPIASLPVDPVNTTSSGEYYVYVTNGTQYELMGNPASPKDASDTADFVKGSNVALQTTFPANTVYYTISTHNSSGISEVLYPITFDSHTNTIWAGGVSTGLVTEIHDTSYATTQYPMPSVVEGVAFDSHTNTIWTANEGNDSVTKINDTTYATTTYGIGLGANPQDIVFDSHTNTIWVGNDNGAITKIDDTSYATTTYPIAPANTQGVIAFDSHTNTIWMPNVSGSTITVINDTTYATTTVALGGSYRYVDDAAFDPDTNTIWVPEDDGTVTVINDATYVTSSYNVNGFGGGITFDPHTHSMWLVGGNGVVQVNDTTYATTTYTNPFSGLPLRVVFDSNNNSLWVTNQSNYNVWELSPNQ